MAAERSAKDIRIAPVSRTVADAVVERHHYSGKTVNNSQLHFGVFLDGVCHGAMQFGPSLDKRKIQTLVHGTSWNGFIELNRMAFGPALPRNSESRALAVAFRLIRKQYPHIEWVVSFADATQCGDGTIYRASGFVLTGIKKNTQVWAAPTGEKFSRTSLTKGGNNHATGAASMKAYAEAGFRPLGGFQLRYVYFLNTGARSRLSVPVIPFDRIDAMGAKMYKGVSRVGSADSGTPAPTGGGGAIPTPTLHLESTP